MFGRRVRGRTLRGLFALAWLACAIAAQAAVIEGTVLERQTGRALARARVLLMPISAGGAQTSVFTDTHGGFSIQAAAGAYVLNVERRGYAPAFYGQKTWNSPGTPIVVESEGRFAANVQLSRLGAILGQVLDENGVGLPDFQVYAYRDTKPLQLTAQGVTDDRGVFRIGGLSPGRYRVRSGPKELPDGVGMLPAFYGGAEAAEGSQTVAVRLDSETEGIRITPVPGRVLRLGGRVAFQVVDSVYLYSDLGSKLTRVDAAGRFTFDELAPGRYELIAESLTSGQKLTGYATVWLKEDIDDVLLEGAPVPVIQFRCEDPEGKPLATKSMSMMVSRSSPPDDSRTQYLSCGEAATGSVGSWQIVISTPADFYVAGVSVQGKPLESSEISLLPGDRIEIAVAASDKPASLKGTVTGQDDRPAIGSMVFLRAADAGVERRLFRSGFARTGQDGAFLLKGLPPGRYLVAASFDVQTADDIDWSDPSVKTVNLEEGKQATVALDR